MTEVLKTSNSCFSRNYGMQANPILSVQRYEVKSPAPLVDPEKVIAATKEEEWITKKKVELTTKKQIETRVKRQVVLEDGKVVEDSGPIVTTNTTKDTEKQEHEQTEHRNLGDNDSPDKGWITVPNSSGLVKEVRENKVKSREETNEVLETEDVQHLGDITDEAYIKAIRSQRKDLRLALRQASSEILSPAIPNGRIVHHSRNNRKVVDSENTKHLSEVQSDGRLVTETTKTTEHEEINNVAEPDNDDNDDNENDYETHHQSSQRFRKTKDQEFVQYLANGVKIGEKMTFEAENVEGDRRGDPDSLKLDTMEWESLSERIRRMRREKQQKLEAERMDALTKKPLNIDQEEETRKVETSKWLEHHFGSESHSSHSSVDDEESPKKTKTSSSFINVVMKSSKCHNAHSRKALYKDASEWNGNTSRHTLTNGISEHILSAPKSPAPAKNHIYELHTGNVKKISKDDYTYSTFKPVKEKETLNSNAQYFVEETTSPISSPLTELETSPLYSSIKRKYNNTEATQSSYDLPSSSTNDNLKSTAPFDKHRLNGYDNEGSKSVQTDQKYSTIKRGERIHKLWSQSERKLNDIGDSDVRFEPHPDYSPRLHRKVPSSPDIRSSPSSDIGRSKVYQNTRFSAEIIPMKPKKAAPNRPERKSSSLGGTLRRIIGKLHGSASKSDHKNKSVNGVSHENGTLVSSKNPNHHNSYHSFNNIDNNILENADNTHNTQTNIRRSTQNSPFQPKQKVKYTMSYEEPERLQKRNAATIHKPNYSIMGDRSQTLDRNHHSKKERHSYYGTAKHNSPSQKYYLGEDPFNGSIYGKEKEYDETKQLNKKYKNGYSTDDEKKSVKSQIISGMNNLLGNRFSKSTNKLGCDYNQHSKMARNINFEDRGVQTMPRKSKKQVFINDPSSDQENKHSRHYSNKHNSQSSGAFNSYSTNYQTPTPRSKEINLMGPQKPARTYRSSLLRSKSFNQQLGPRYRHNYGTSTYKSNPQLHKLDESPSPLKSPGIVTSINRSTCDLSKSTNDNKNDGYSYNNSRRTFLKGLKNQAPEIYKTLHEDEEYEVGPNNSSNHKIVTSTPIRNKHKGLEYSKSFQSGNNIKKPSVSFKSDYYPSQNKIHRTPTLQ